MPPGTRPPSSQIDAPPGLNFGERRGRGEGTVNSTARWPERLSHIAALLRAEGAAVLLTTADALSTVFAHEISPDTDWRSIFDADAVVRALGGTPTGIAVAAGRWDQQAAYALLTRIDLPEGEALLCALRHGVPFDTVELGTASAAAELLAMSVGDGRSIAEARHDSLRQMDRVALLERLLAGLEQTRDASALLAQAAEEIARSIGAGGTSIMLVEGKELRVRASVGLGVPLGHGQPIGEGIAGWVASKGQKIVLRGPIDDDRFRGSDPEAGEAVIMPLWSGDEVVGVLNVKRPTGDSGFDEKLEVHDAIAARAVDALGLLGHAELEATSRRGTGIRVLAVEDHPVMRLGVRALLEREGLVIAGITATCAEALDLVRENEPDVVLLDLGLPDAVGPDAVERIREVSSSVPIIAFSVERTPEMIRAVLRAGANGYVSKDAPSSQVVAALQAAVQGLTALGTAEAHALSRSGEPIPLAEQPEETTATEEEGEPGAAAPAREPLTPRELELLRYLAEGYTNKEIARAMVLAEDTVK